MQTNYIAGPYTTNRASHRAAVKMTVKDHLDVQVFIRMFRRNTEPSYRNTALSTVQRSLIDMGYSRRQARKLSHSVNQFA